MRNSAGVAGMMTLVGFAAMAAVAAEPSPFVGEWHWNQAASTSVPGEPLPREVVLKVSSADTAHVAWTLITVDAKGGRHVQPFNGSGDGKPVPVVDATDGATDAFTVTASTFDSVYADRDGATDRSSCTLSADHKLMTCRGTESDGKGHSVDYVDVYDRK
jgi:hypothetical protein